MFGSDEEVPDVVKTQASYRAFEIEANKYRIRYYRSLVAFFFLGVCQNFGSIVILTAAEDIMVVNSRHEKRVTETLPIIDRCSTHGTGVILLTFIVTATIISFAIPFLPWFIHLRIALSIILSMLGFGLISFTYNNLVIALVGVVLLAASAVLSEASFLQYTSYFHLNVISTWSSGTGVAGVIGALSYTLGVASNYKYTMLSMTSIPVFMGLVFWLLLPVPEEEDMQAVALQRAWNEGEVRNPWIIIVKKYYLIPKVLYKYIGPLGSVYLFEYFINQSMYELIKIKDSMVTENMQYNWLQFAYQAGVFISRSSAPCIYIKHIWVMSLLQFGNVLIFTTAAIFMYIKNFWILLVLAVEEGLLGGAAYVNTFIKIGKEETEEEKQFMSAMTCFGNNACILLAGLFALIAHNLICKMSS